MTDKITDEELIGLLCKDHTFKSHIESEEKKPIHDIIANWNENRLEVVFETCEVMVFDLAVVIKGLRKAWYEKEYLQ
jgi:hypothetical protein